MEAREEKKELICSVEDCGKTALHHHSSYEPSILRPLCKGHHVKEHRQTGLREPTYVYKKGPLTTKVKDSHRYCKIIEGNRVTVPYPVMRALDLQVGDLVRVTFKKAADAEGDEP